MIEVKEVSLSYKAINNGQVLEALHKINLTITKGERCVLLGPSGSGKTSLLYLLAGLLKPSRGEILMDNIVISGPQEKVALMLQDYGLFPWKTVMANAELGLEVRKAPQKERKEKVSNLLEQLGIKEYALKYPFELSGGQRQRVAIARALALEPEILLMDEPFSALDSLTREQMQKLILHIWQERQFTFVLVTHSIEEAVFLGEKIVILSEGPGKILEIVENKNPAEKAFRDTLKFYNQCTLIRSLIEGQRP
ncbi:MAG: ABC transporter ATP-binding protein [Peptococcaceae bacterium BICA1-8]|nr:MAG: ABC transporter ATP-binding protein [Peptococcaceae bacterium BICA1-8]